MPIRRLCHLDRLLDCHRCASDWQLRDADTVGRHLSPAFFSSPARTLRRHDRVQDRLSRLARAKDLGPEAAREWLEEVIGKIEFQNGGRVEIQLPTPPSDEPSDRGEAK
jgi:hypothetical protein